MLGAALAVTLVVVILLETTGNGAAWALLSEQQFKVLYPAADYLMEYMVPSIKNTLLQSIMYGGITGATLSVVKWAFSGEK